MVGTAWHVIWTAYFNVNYTVSERKRPICFS